MFVYVLMNTFILHVTKRTAIRGRQLH